MASYVKRTQTQALLEAAREKLGGATDYKLAKMMELPRPRISDYHHGRRQADAYACTRLAMILDRDPLEIIAQVEADSAKTEARRQFWAGFPSGLRRTALGIALCGTAAFSGLGLPGGAEAASSSHNGGLRQSRKSRKAPGGAFFSSAGFSAGSGYPLAGRRRVPCGAAGLILTVDRLRNPVPLTG